MRFALHQWFFTHGKNFGRSKDGTQTVEIELSTKVLDEDSRIQNTLAHEMCHLACWIIDKNPQENHGRLFKSWYVAHSCHLILAHLTSIIRGAKVMRKVPHIEVNVRPTHRSIQFTADAKDCRRLDTAMKSNTHMSGVSIS